MLVYREKPAEEDPRRYRLPEEERERLTRDEMNALIYLKCALAASGYAWEIDDKRLDYIPSGKQRLRLAMGAVKSICDDIEGTIPEKSAKRMANITHDFKIALIPITQTEGKNFVIHKEDAETLMNAVLNEKCAKCIKSDEEARRECGLYKVLEAYCPLNDYGNGLMCQYGKSELK